MSSILTFATSIWNGSSVAKTASSVAGGTGGWMAGAAAASKVSGAVLDEFITDDAEEMLDIVQEVFASISTDYLLGESDAEKAIDRFKNRDMPDFLRDMYASDDREDFAKQTLLPIVRDVAKSRKVIKLPSDKTILESFGRIAENGAKEKASNKAVKVKRPAANSSVRRKVAHA